MPAEVTPIDLDDADYLGALLELFETPSNVKQNPPKNPAEGASEQLGNRFVKWLRAGLEDHTLIINDSRAKVHTVNGTFFLVTPGIF
ncbi:hypothetical protein D3C79_1008830 [compost metagenome]